MGSDDLYHKRKAKKARELARRAGQRKARDRVLIVCEGAKTEPNYLKEMRASLNLTNADIEVCGEDCGSDPVSIVRYALERFEEDRDFDRVYCVFDKDKHPTYSIAVDYARRKRMPTGRKLETVKSVPCFEYWVLLHFKATTKPYVGAGGRSACDEVTTELKREFREYGKGMKGLYKKIGDRTDMAIANARSAMEAAVKTGTDNPSTEMHQLVEYLRNL